jgi:hypothetical protein
MDQRFLRLEKKVEQIEGALADQLQCDEGIEFKVCRFPEFAAEMIEALRANEQDREALAERLELLIK